MEDFVREKVSGWVSKMEKLAMIAKFQPQAVGAIFTYGLMHRWHFQMRTVPGVELGIVPTAGRSYPASIPTGFDW